MQRTESNRHLLPKYAERARLEREQAKVLGDLIIETGQRLPSADDQIHDLHRGRDESYLRGVPIIGRGSAGAIPGTRPGDGLRLMG